jgi:hypothetical protein
LLSARILFAADNKKSNATSVRWVVDIVAVVPNRCICRSIESLSSGSRTRRRRPAADHLPAVCSEINQSRDHRTKGKVEKLMCRMVPHNRTIKWSFRTRHTSKLNQGRSCGSELSSLTRLSILALPSDLPSTGCSSTDNQLELNPQDGVREKSLLS